MGDGEQRAASAVRADQDGPAELLPGTALPAPAVTSLVAAPPPSVPFSELPPDRVEFYVRAAMHQDRSPGNVLVVMHPGKRHKVPRGLFEALAARGFSLHEVDTDADRVASVERIREALQLLASEGKPLDILVVSGDGSLDHHVLVAAYAAFYPDLVHYRAGTILLGSLDEQALATLPADYREAFCSPLPAVERIDPSEATIKQIWLLRLAIERALARRVSARRLARKARRELGDPLLALAVLSALFPDRVLLRPHGFDLAGLAGADLERSFQGLYPFVRCICTYPAGTAADNAVFAGVPGWGYSLLAGLITRFDLFDPVRRRLERRVVDAFVHYFTSDGVVVPARLSAVAFDGDWQRVSSHAAGGPGAGRFFTADLVNKTKGMLGYLKRIPAAIIAEGIFGSTVVRIRSRFANGTEKSFTEAQMAEGLYTNRTFIAGVGSVPTTDPTAFAGQSSLCVLPPIWSRDTRGHRIINLRGLGGFTEAIIKGVLARLLHVTGLGVGTLAGGGTFLTLQPEHQVAIKEGESIEIEYLHLDHSPRAVAIQVSGDPFQAQRMSIRVLWGPVPILARSESLLLTATKRSLANVHLQQSFSLRGVYIGGVYHFHHHVGDDWNAELAARTGLVRPRLHLPRLLPLAQRVLTEAWQQAGAGEFVDTTESGLALWRRGRFAHNNDQTAHLILLREQHGGLLVRQVRAMGSAPHEIYELRAEYRKGGGAFIMHRSQTIHWQSAAPPQILQEDYYFRSAEAFQQEAPSFFPVVATSPEQPTLLDAEASDLESESE
ncbi:MAG: hypothetical protein ABIJ09_24100 [Pseudomonadota bacterium]